MGPTDERPPERLRDAFLLGYEPPGPDQAAHLVRRALAGRAEQRQLVRERRVRLAATALAVALAVLVVGTLLVVRLSATARREPVPAAPPSPTSAAAVVYAAGDDPTHLRQVGYDGFERAGSWTLAQPVSVSPDGAYVVTFDPVHSGQVIDGRGQVAATISSTPGSPSFGLWSADGARLCQLSVVDPLRWQLTIQDVPAVDGFGPRTIILGEVPYPPLISLVACDLAVNRAIVVEPLTSEVPAPPKAERQALVIDLSSGRTIRRVSIGDSSRGAVFSPDGRYAATVDYDHGTSTILDLTTGRPVRTTRTEVRGFSADGTRLVENTLFELRNRGELSTTRIADVRTGRVLYSAGGWTNTVRSGPGSADLALDVLPQVPEGDPYGPGDLLIVRANGTRTLIPNATLY